MIPATALPHAKMLILSTIQLTDVLGIKMYNIVLTRQA